MNSLATFVKRHPLVAYFVLAYAFSWALVALYSAGFIFALLALFGPALAAISVTWLIEGRAGVKALLGRVGIWRVGIRWYVVAIGLPVVVALAALCIHSLITGTPLAINSGTPLSLLVIIALLVIGEELGWRGFALPHFTQWWLVGAGFAIVAIAVLLVEGTSLARNATPATLEPQGAVVQF